MKVLAVTYCRAMLGANRSLLALIKDMRERFRVETEVLMPSVNDGELAEVLDREGFVHYEMSMKMWVYPADADHKGLKSLSARIKTFFLAGSIGRLLASNSYDLIYTNNSTVQYGAVLAKKWKLPHVWHIREFGSRDYGIEYSYPPAQRIRYFKDAYAVVVISEAMKKYTEEELCPGADVRRVYNGIYLDKKPRFGDESYTVPGDVQGAEGQQEPVKLACVGALQSGKNQMELLQAVKLLMDRNWDKNSDRRTGFRLYLVGDGPDEGSLRRYVNDNSLGSVVEFCGYRPDIRELLDTMDIGVICSKSEGFGRVTCEYMEASMPVVGADSGATPELIEDGYNGYLYPPGKTDILADRLQELITDGSKRIRMGLNAYERVYRDFSLSVNTDEMYRIFSQAMESKRLG